MTRRSEDATEVRRPPNEAEINLALRVFQDPTHVYHQAQATDERDALAQDRRALGLRPRIPRRPA